MPRLARFIGSALLVAAAAPLHAQIPLSPKSLGMGGSMAGVARGHEALFLNPANLGLADRPRWSAGALGVSAGGLASGLPFVRFGDLVEYDDLSDGERTALLADIPDSGVALGFDVRAPLATIQIGPFAAGLAYSTFAEHALSRDLVELLLNGHEEGRTDYEFAGSVGRRATFWDLAVGYGASTGSVTWGATARYLHGAALIRSQIDDIRVDLVGRDVTVDYAALMRRGGSGMALDLGVGYQPRADLDLGLTISNAFARLSWSDDLYLREIALSGSEIDESSIQDLFDRYVESERRVESGDLEEIGISVIDLDREAHLPTNVAFSAGWRPLAGTSVSLSASADVTTGELQGLWDRSLGFGVQQRIAFTQIRAGVGTNLEGGRLLSGGFSLGPIDLGVAHIEDEEHAIGDRTGWVAMFGISTRTF